MFRILLWGGIASAIVAVSPVKIPGVSSLVSQSGLSSSGSKWVSTTPRLGGLVSVSSWGSGSGLKSTRPRGSAVQAIVGAAEAELNRKRARAGTLSAKRIKVGN